MAGQRCVCVSVRQVMWSLTSTTGFSEATIYIGIGQYYDKNPFTSFGSHGAGQQGRICSRVSDPTEQDSKAGGGHFITLGTPHADATSIVTDW
jgi:hypothetical protein